MSNWKDRVEHLIVSNREEALDKLTEAQNELIRLGFDVNTIDSHFWDRINSYPNEVRNAIIMYIDARNDYKVYE